MTISAIFYLNPDYCYQSNNKTKRSFTQLDSRKQIIVFLDTVTTTHKGSSTPTKMSKLNSRQTHWNADDLVCDDYANYDQFAGSICWVNLFQISVYKTMQHAAYLCNKFEVIWTNGNRVMGQRSWKVFGYHVTWENGLILLPTKNTAAI